MVFYLRIGLRTGRFWYCHRIVTGRTFGCYMDLYTLVSV